MSRISSQGLAQAAVIVRAMDSKQKEQLVDEIFRAQPHLLGSVLVQQRLGASLQKMEFLIDVLFVCFQAMKESGLTWPVITEDEMDRQMQRFVAAVKFGQDVSKKRQDRAMQQYIAGHPEKALLAYVQTETADWLKRIVPEESDKYVILAAANIVNCIAFASLPAATATPKEQTRKTR